MNDAPNRARRWTTGLFAAVIFGGSWLLFIVQPMVARLALPLLGGTPNVWNSAMLVFQLLLLGGYAYAYALSRLTPRWQVAIHLALLLASVLTLPVGLADLPPAAAGWEFVWVPALFLVTIGPVFFLLSAQASLLQNWFAASAPGANPYRLYVASNLGSFAGLLAYPFWLEPSLTLSGQSRTWSGGYLIVICGVAALGLGRWMTDRGSPALPQRSAVGGEAQQGRPPMLLWLAFAAVPSGLMLSTTTLLTTDLMAMPLLWVIPLGLYLLSFTVAFSDKGHWTNILSGYAPFLLLLVGGLAMISGGQSNPAIALAMVALLFVLSVALHGRLYRARPAPARLTLFYLVMAAGGALGGLFTGLLAPLLFDWVYEHALLLLAAALLIPHRQFIASLRRLWSEGRGRWPATAVLLGVAGLLAWALSGAVERGQGETILLLAAALIVLGIAVIGMRWVYAAVLACLMLGLGGMATLSTSFSGDRTRSYFGVYSVVPVRDGDLRRLVHGTTMHGQQWVDPARRDDPTGYYGPSSGIGLVLAEAHLNARIGIVGLGVGTLACYRQDGQQWIFFEIDPKVVAFSRRGTFTFLADCAPDARIVLGDARLSLASGSSSGFDVLAVDAFTSDAIPIHLLTREAFATYGRALDEDGVLALHISNRFFDLAPMVSALAQAGGWNGRIRRHTEDVEPGQSPSIWIALSRSDRAIAGLERRNPGVWEHLPAPATEVWTDDHASLLQLFGD
jgi:hypothetical protein